MAIGFSLLFGWTLLLRMRTALNERKSRALRLHGLPRPARLRHAENAPEAVGLAARH
jgi:hypothetical protein